MKSPKKNAKLQKKFNKQLIRVGTALTAKIPIVAKYVREYLP